MKVYTLPLSIDAGISNLALCLYFNSIRNMQKLLAMLKT